jgi:hypothetical protein
MSATDIAPADAARRHVSKECVDITIKVASSREERQGAFRLAYNSYRRAGLCETSDEGLRITPYQLLPTTDIIIAILRGEVISTLSLVRDGDLGLPLESLYPDEVRQRRAAGLKLAEVSCLADRRKDAARFFSLFSELAQVMIQMADRDGVDQLLIAVHPRHARMYCRAMAFKQVGDTRDYDAVNGNPAVLLCLDLAYGKTQCTDRWARFAGEPLPEFVVTPQPICEFDRAYFEQHLQRSEKSTDACPGSQAGRQPAEEPSLECA